METLRSTGRLAVPGNDPARWQDRDRATATRRKVVRVHSGNDPHEEMDRRAITCLDQARLEGAGLAAEPLRHDYFAWGYAPQKRGDDPRVASVSWRHPRP